MWLFSVVTLGVLGIVWLSSRAWIGAHSGDLGWMSQQWLAEHRAGHR